MRILHCNRCGKVITGGNRCKIEARLYSKGKHISGEGGKIDLCESCYKEFTDFATGRDLALKEAFE